MRWSSLFASPAPVVRQLWAEDSHWVGAMHAGSFARGWDATEVESLVTDPTIIADALEDGRSRSPLGFILTRRAADEAEILSIAIDRCQRGRGLSSILLSTHTGHLTQIGVARLFLEVDEANRAARALYSRSGFREVGRRQSYYRQPDGSASTALVLRADL